MGVEPVGQALQERRAVPGPGAVDGAGCRLQNCLGIHAVDGLGRDAERRGAPGDRACRRVLHPHRGCELVVLADEDDRQPAQRRQVQRFEQHALVDRAVAEERDGDAIVPGAPVRPGRPGRDRGRGADDRVGAVDARADVRGVHRPAAPAVEAGLAARQLGQHADRVGALGQHVPVAAMGAGDEIVRAQRRADARRNRLLADVRVDAPGDHAAAHHLDRPLLEPADQPHGPVQVGGVSHAVAAAPPPLRRRRPLADGREDAVPQPGPGREGEVDRLGALRPLGVVVAAQVGEHLHRHRRVLLAVDLDVAAR